MDFQDMLGYLQGLLTNRQNTQSGQWQQGLGFSKEQLAAQQAQFGQTLAEQTAARLAANQLEQQRQKQAELAQQFEQQATTKKLNSDLTSAMMARGNDPQGMDILRSLGFFGPMTSPTEAKWDMMYNNELGVGDNYGGLLNLGLKFQQPTIEK